MPAAIGTPRLDKLADLTAQPGIDTTAASTAAGSGPLSPLRGGPVAQLNLGHAQGALSWQHLLPVRCLVNHAPCAARRTGGSSGQPRRGRHAMKAVRLQARGGPEQLRYEEAPDPVPHPGYALVRVRASGITPAELGWPETWERDGAPRQYPIPGHELAGVVAQAPEDGPVRAGDAVFGLTEWDRDGTLAEYTTIRAGDLATTPTRLDHVHTAALPLSALTAWQAFHRHAHLQAGQTVLVHGAAGGVGSYAVQLAHEIGARVIGTASSTHRAFLEELGCDQVIDYTTTAFEKVVRDVDVVLDPIGGETLRRSYAVLRPGGWLVALHENPDQQQLEAHRIHGAYFVVEPSRDELTQIAALVEAGRLRAIVSHVFPLAQAREAYEQALAGHNRGKTVLTVSLIHSPHCQSGVGIAP